MEQGWRSIYGESARLTSMWPGFKSRLRPHMWVEFVVGSLPCSERFFFGHSGFPLSPNANSTRNQVDEEPLGGCANLQIIIHLFLFCLAPTGKKCFNLFLTTNMAAVTSRANQQ